MISKRNKGILLYNALVVKFFDFAAVNFVYRYTNIT